MGREARRKLEARIQALANSLFILQNKPSDMALYLIAIAVGIVYGLGEKTPTWIVFWLLVIFGLLVHPIWNFSWIKKSNVRRISTLAVLAIALSIFGYNQLPGPRNVISDAQLCSNTKLFAQRMRDFEFERFHLLAEGEARERALLMDAKREKERERIRERMQLQYDDWRRSIDRDFSANYLPTAKHLRAELLARLPPNHQDKYIDEGAFSGLLAGIRPISNTADQLDRMASKLCP